MSYIRANVVDRATTRPFVDTTYVAHPDLDMNLDDEILDFVLALIREVNSLREGEALVVWKEIY